jgi:uncharacterized protein (DUF2249 family)
MTGPPEDVGLDLRRVPPQERHELARCSLGMLAPGQGLRLSLDHDPAPLRAILARAYPGLRWRYLRRGPGTWTVRVARARPSAKQR